MTIASNRKPILPNSRKQGCATGQAADQKRIASEDPRHPIVGTRAMIGLMAMIMRFDAVQSGGHQADDNILCLRTAATCDGNYPVARPLWFNLLTNI